MTEWIKCSERLPEERDGFVLAYLIGGTIEQLIWCERGWWECSSGYFCPRDHVTHWMPLPDAPEVEG